MPVGKLSGKYLVHREHIVNPSLTYDKLYPKSCIFTIGNKVYNISQKWNSTLKETERSCKLVADIICFYGINFRKKV